jgi:hypothetical protein
VALHCSRHLRPAEAALNLMPQQTRRAAAVSGTDPSESSERGRGTKLADLLFSNIGGPSFMTSPEKYRHFAQECLEMARSAKDERTRAIFSLMAQVWFRLAEEKASSGSSDEKV